jgi:hypothetical protein
MELQVVTGIDFSLGYYKENTFKVLLKIKPF